MTRAACQGDATSAQPYLSAEVAPLAPSWEPSQEAARAPSSEVWLAPAPAWREFCCRRVKRLRFRRGLPLAFRLSKHWWSGRTPFLSLRPTQGIEPRINPWIGL